jgi:hypothetical protein
LRSLGPSSALGKRDLAKNSLAEFSRCGTIAMAAIRTPRGENMEGRIDSTDKQTNQSGQGREIATKTNKQRNNQKGKPNNNNKMKKKREFQNNELRAIPECKWNSMRGTHSLLVASTYSK